MIVGIDEVGRGAWAGPLVVGAVLLGGASINGLTDSKKLTRRQRIQLDQEIRRTALAIGLGWVSARYIDELGLSAALKLGAERALWHIRRDYSEIIIDGTIRLIDHPKVTLMKKADLLVPSVSAASIVAKVARDNYMAHLDTMFPGYDLGRHVGYGTAAHREAIALHGPAAIHRMSFAPLARYGKTADIIKTDSRVTTKQIGDKAEVAAVEYLVVKGHTVIERNWRTRYCEIDIVSQKDGTLYFTEVKYRKNSRFGGGLAAVTPKKLQQMQFAAEFYMTRIRFEGDGRLTVADVTGVPPKVRQLFELT